MTVYKSALEMMEMRDIPSCDESCDKRELSMTINENKLAKEIADREGGKLNLTIAQIKEVLRITLDLLSEHTASQILLLIEKHEE
jgi:hypothetical protein